MRTELVVEALAAAERTRGSLAGAVMHTDLSRWSSADLGAVAMAINNRPRKTLGWRTPAEVFEEQLRSLQQPGVAATN